MQQLPRLALGGARTFDLPLAMQVGEFAPCLIARESGSTHLADCGLRLGELSLQRVAFLPRAFRRKASTSVPTGMPGTMISAAAPVLSSESE